MGEGNDAESEDAADQTAHCFEQTGNRDRLDQRFMRTKESGHAAIVEIFPAARHGDDLEVWKLVVEHPGEFKTIHIRHQDIGDNEIDRMALEMGQSVSRRGRLIDAVPRPFQRPPEELSG